MSHENWALSPGVIQPSTAPYFLAKHWRSLFWLCTEFLHLHNCPASPFQGPKLSRWKKIIPSHTVPSATDLKDWESFTHRKKIRGWKSIEKAFCVGSSQVFLSSSHTSMTCHYKIIHHAPAKILLCFRLPFLQRKCLFRLIAWISIQILRYLWNRLAFFSITFSEGHSWSFDRPTGCISEV